MRKILQLLVVVTTFAAFASAQKIDLALTVGDYHPVNNSFNTGNAFVIEGNIGARVASVPFLALYVEVPVAGTPKEVPVSLTLGATGLTSAGSYSSLFVAPGLRLKLAPSAPLSPYVAVGGGLAHFNRSATQTPSGSSSSVNKGVFDIAGGIDMKVAPFLSLRAEIRDFYSGNPELTLSQITGTFNQRQHNIVGTAGVVVRF